MRLALLSCLALPLVVAPELSGVTAEAGTTVTKTFENVLSLELVEIGATVDGEEQELPDDAMPELTISDEEEVIFVDEYVAVADGQATELLRTFTTLVDNSAQVVITPSGESMEQEEEGESELEGQTVRFLWDEDAEEFDATFVDGEDQDESLLEDLRADADFLYLLSDETMEIGSSWEVDVLAFDLISSPSGNLHIDSPDSDEEDDELFADSFRDGLVGTLEGTYESLEDDIATIVFDGEITTSFEIEDEDGEVPSTQTFDFTFEVSGTLLWNTETGVASEFQFGGDVEMQIDRVMAFGESEYVQSQRLEGEFESTAKFE